MTQAQVAGAVAGGDGEIAQLVASARDALTDDMVTRLGATLGDGLDLLDRVNRSGVAQALPAIARLVENGDLERLVSLARLFGAVEDSLSDDIVHRLAIVASGLAALADRLVRNEGFLRLVDLLGREDVQATVTDLLDALSEARSDTRLKGSPGGWSGLFRVAKDPAMQDMLVFMSAVGQRFRKDGTEA